MSTQSQKNKVLSILAEAAYQHKDGWVDAMEFVRMDRPILRYSAVIFGLKKQGAKIESRIKPGKRWAEYRLVGFNPIPNNS